MGRLCIECGKKIDTGLDVMLTKADNSGGDLCEKCWDNEWKKVMSQARAKELSGETRNLINWFRNLPLKNKVVVFNYINNKNLERQEVAKNIRIQCPEGFTEKVMKKIRGG